MAKEALESGARVDEAIRAIVRANMVTQSAEGDGMTAENDWDGSSRRKEVALGLRGNHHRHGRKTKRSAAGLREPPAFWSGPPAAVCMGIRKCPPPTIVTDRGVFSPFETPAAWSRSAPDV